MTERDIAAETRALLEGLTAPDILNHVMPAIAGAFWNLAGYTDVQMWQACLQAAVIPPLPARIRLYREQAERYATEAARLERDGNTLDDASVGRILAALQAGRAAGAPGCGDPNCPGCGDQTATVTLPDSNGTSQPVAYL